MNHITPPKLTKFVLSIILSLSFLMTPAVAQAVSIDVGPSVGAKAPALHVIDKNQQAGSIADLSAEKGLIVLFFRSADWCPFCKRHLLELNEYADKFKTLGYGLSAISYDSLTVLNDFSQLHQITYPLLSDQAAATVKAYGIINSQYKLGDDNYGIPYPGVVVINPAGEVTYKYFFEGYKKRVKFSVLYEQLNSSQ